MASKKFNKGSSEWNLFMDYWAICQKYWIPEDTDEYWERLIDEMNAFCEKYENTNEIFARELMLACLNTLEKKVKDKN